MHLTIHRALKLLPLAMLALAGSASPAAFAAAASNASDQRPRLVLQLTVDQLRGDALQRYRDRLSANGGFQLLKKRSIYYTNAHYLTANTMTASGHAVLVTGADTAQHGMPGNDWYDSATGKPVYCTDDARFTAVGEPAKSSNAMSPANLTSTTLGDELVSATGGRSRAFAIAGKDRSAIIPGGYRGKALWFSSATGGIVTTSYYYNALPSWVSAWNDRRLYQRYQGKEWTTLAPLATYVNAAGADNPYAHASATLGRKFPHPLSGKSDTDLIKALRFTPFLDELTVDFARALIAEEKVGQGSATDYLSISFSSTDYVGHMFGPNSVEAEDNFRRLDATLGQLLAFIDQTIGLDRTLIVLSADHGADDIPEERSALGFDAGRFRPEEVRTQLNTALKKRFGIAEDLIAALVVPGIYLDHAKIAALKLDPATVASALADAARTAPGIAFAFTRAELLSGVGNGSALFAQVQRAFHPTRSGDVTLVQKQFWYFDDEPDTYASMHGSPYSYDTYVPILLAVPGLKPGISNAAVSPAQIAPTLASLLGIKPPSGCACAELLPMK